MSIHTTAINITKPESYDLLSARFTLVRYAVPLSVSSSQRRNEFGYFHNQMKEQINAPYYVFTYDALGTKWAVYVLYPRIELEATLPNVTIGNASLPSRRIEFSEIRLHILLKLLQIQYFRT